ncbi:MarR family winged helix-turn-helix transcriptional regulator [Xylanimonas protaetiae]|uniref:MarR family transcriptional regulator n=1 Tax=Xylanimonas protaetiae TaxID=2509457 RepID=A0A4P6F107_9MICO|nr:MarR family transcriptional regulator [Xylanimonas protaetiae]QAY69134.1 MarR family transcriptional regulator [Xylanimonas protaetiae]
MTSAPALASELRVGTGRFLRRLRAERGDADLPAAQFGVLTELTRRGPLTPGELAHSEGVRPPAMTRTVSALVDLGFVTKSEHPTDGRLVVVDLTDAGRREVAETRRRRDAWLSLRLGALTPQDRATLARANDLLQTLASG